MNRLVGTIDWSQRSKEITACKDHFSGMQLELSVERARVFTFDEVGYFHNPATGVLVSIIGYIANIYDIRDSYELEATNDVEILENIYSATSPKEGMAFLDDLDGVYFILIYDGKRQKVYLFQSQFGCCIPIYYVDAPGRFVFSTSLKLLLRETGISREFHIPSVLDFMSYSELIPNENTLVKGVNKLVTQRNMIIDLRSSKKDFMSFKPPDEVLTRQEAEEKLLDSIGKKISQIVLNLRKPDYFLTLTGGWDSNLMLSFLNNTNARKIGALTINGGGATNEIPAVQHVLEFYEKGKIEHFTHTMKSSIFDALPNIVWILEGYMVQSGMFLRYAIASLMRDMGGASIFLGSGADPILNTDMGPGGNVVYEPYPNGAVFYVLKELKRTVCNLCIRSMIGDVYFSLKRENAENRIKRLCLRPGFRERYNTQIDYNMKMHELMLNGFDIQGLYPFINKDTVSCAKALRPLNHAKSLYKQKVREHLGPVICSVLKKSGSVVDTENLFKTKNYWPLKALDSWFVHRILPAGQIEKMKTNPAEYSSSLLKILYLSLFDKLFLSGKYDDSFDDAQIDSTLGQLLS